MALTRSEFDGGKWPTAGTDSSGSMANTADKWAQAVNLTAGRPSTESPGRTVDQFVQGLGAMNAEQRKGEIKAYLLLQADPCAATAALLKSDGTRRLPVDTQQDVARSIISGYLDLTKKPGSSVDDIAVRDFLETYGDDRFNDLFADSVAERLPTSKAVDLAVFVGPDGGRQILAGVFRQVQDADVDTQTALRQTLAPTLFSHARDVPMINTINRAFVAAQGDTEDTEAEFESLNYFIAHGDGANPSTEAFANAFVMAKLEKEGISLDAKEAGPILQAAGNGMVEYKHCPDEKDVRDDTRIANHMRKSYRVEVDSELSNGAVGRDPDGTP